MLEQERPVNVILIAEPSAGKSQMLKKLQCPITTFLTDLTTRDISIVIGNRDKRIILLSDMQSIFSHKSTVVNMTTQALRNLLEEGIFNDPFNGQKVNRQFGLISAIPPDEFHEVQKKFYSGGLNTRFLLLEYRYARKTIAQIHDSIEDGTYVRKEDNANLSSLPEGTGFVRVVLSGDVARRCRSLSDALKSDEIGTRTHHQIRRLVMAVSARRGCPEATLEDYNVIEQFSEFLDPHSKTVKVI